ncbi:hypothetical protein [Lentzea sp. E54]|uniref:hypothetical protein n=1 Tax=Lentzea xerophila TaxID=3435883 RepID=UPI003DA5CBCB
MPYESGHGWRFGNGTLPDGTQGYGWTYGPQTTWRPERHRSTFPDPPSGGSVGDGLLALVSLIVLGFVLHAAGLPVGQWLDTALSWLAERAE